MRQLHSCCAMHEQRVSKEPLRSGQPRAAAGGKGDAEGQGSVVARQECCLCKLLPARRLTFWPVATLPEKTRPNAKKRPLSEVGIILETYIISGPSASQLRMAVAYWSSRGPCGAVGRGQGRVSVPLGDGKAGEGGGCSNAVGQRGVDVHGRQRGSCSKASRVVGSQGKRTCLKRG